MSRHRGKAFRLPCSRAIEAMFVVAAMSLVVGWFGASAAVAATRLTDGINASAARPVTMTLSVVSLSGQAWELAFDGASHRWSQRQRSVDCVLCGDEGVRRR